MSPTQAQAPPVSDLLTVIITTSVTPSIPTTDLLSAILAGFKTHCPLLLGCRVIVVFDSYDQIVPWPRLKKGHVTSQQAEDWDLYKARVKRLVLERFSGESTDNVKLSVEQGEAEYGSLRTADNAVAFTAERTQNGRVTFIEPSRRLGFGLAVRSALRMVETPYVWLQQHDWNLVVDIPVESILHIMQSSQNHVEAPVKYVCFSAIRMLSYATSSDVELHPALKELTEKLKRDYVSPSRPEVKVPLTPLFLWHDKPHIASTEHYLARVFPSRLAMLRGDFIEDKIGQRARLQMKEGMWSKWATWLYYPEEGKQLCLRHLQGRIWRGTDGQSRQIAIFRQQRSNEPEDVESQDALDASVAENAAGDDESWGLLFDHEDSG